MRMMYNLDTLACRAPSVDGLHDFGRHVLRCGIFAKRIDELSVWVHEVEKDTTSSRQPSPYPSTPRNSPMIHQIIILGLGVRRRRKVDAITPACLFHLIVRPRQADHARVEIPDVGGDLWEGIACWVARYEDWLNDGFAEEFICQVLVCVCGRERRTYQSHRRHHSSCPAPRDRYPDNS